LKPSLVDRVSLLLEEVVTVEVISRLRTLDSHEIETKPSAGDPDDLVTVVDRLVETWLTRGLAALLPGAAVIGEEAAHVRPELLDALAGTGPVWIIDPIDGTRNFVRGEDTFGVMIALVDRGATRAAWIALPARRQTFVAEEGSGAYLDGMPLWVPDDPARPPRGTLYTRFMPPSLAESVSAASRGRYTEQPGAGAAAIEYTSIARGEKELVVYHRLHPWDHAPGALLLSEAGGCVQHPDGRPYNPRDTNEVTILAASPAVMEEARAWLGPAVLTGGAAR
jgi:fructose-1,6-bisphosphatase/inositol monophosphatase family enzyme